MVQDIFYKALILFCVLFFNCYFCLTVPMQVFKRVIVRVVQY